MKITNMLLNHNSSNYNGLLNFNIDSFFCCCLIESQFIFYEIYKVRWISIKYILLSANRFGRWTLAACWHISCFSFDHIKTVAICGLVIVCTLYASDTIWFIYDFCWYISDPVCFRRKSRLVLSFVLSLFKKYSWNALIWLFVTHFPLKIQYFFSLFKRKQKSA